MNKPNKAGAANNLLDLMKKSKDNNTNLSENQIERTKLLLEDLCDQILTLKDPTSEKQYINQFNIEYIHSVLSNNLPEVQKMLSDFNKKGIDIVDFLFVMMNYLPHSRIQSLYMAIALIEFFQNITESENLTVTINTSDLTNYMCMENPGLIENTLLGSRINPRQILPEFRKFPLSEAASKNMKQGDSKPVKIENTFISSRGVRDIDINAPTVIQENDLLLRRLDVTKIHIDKIHHKNNMIEKSVFSQELQLLFTLDAFGSELLCYDTSCQFKKKIQLKRQDSESLTIKDYFWSEREKRMGAIYQDSDQCYLCFWESNDDFQFQKIIPYPIQKEEDELHHLWYVDLLGAWVTADYKNNLHIWDLSLEKTSEANTIKIDVDIDNNSKFGAGQTGPFGETDRKNKTKQYQQGKDNGIFLEDSEKFNEMRNKIGNKANTNHKNKSENPQRQKQGVNILEEVPNLQLVVICSGKCNLSVWDLINRRRLFQIQNQHNHIHSVIFFRTYQILLTSGFDRSIHLYQINSDFNDYTYLNKLYGHQALITNLAVGQGTPMIISSDDKLIVKIWDIRQFECIQTVFLESKSAIRKIHFLSDRIIYISSRVKAIQFDSDQSNQLKEFNAPIRVQFDPAKKLIIVATKQDIRFVDAKNGRTQRIIGGILQDKQDEITVFKSFKQYRKFLVGNIKGELKIFDSFHGEYIQTVTQTHADMINFLYLDAINKMIITGGSDNTIYFHKEEGENFVQIQEITQLHHGQQLSILKVSVYHNIFITAAVGSNMLAIWNYEFGALISTLSIGRQETTQATSIEFINGFAVFLVAASDGNIYLIRFDLKQEHITFYLAGTINLQLSTQFFNLQQEEKELNDNTKVSQDQQLKGNVPSLITQIRTSFSEIDKNPVQEENNIKENVVTKMLADIDNENLPKYAYLIISLSNGEMRIFNIIQIFSDQKIKMQKNSKSRNNYNAHRQNSEDFSNVINSHQITQFRVEKDIIINLTQLKNITVSQQREQNSEKNSESPAQSPTKSSSKILKQNVNRLVTLNALKSKSINKEEIENTKLFLSKQIKNILRAHKDSVNTLQLIAVNEGQVLMTASHDGKLQLWQYPDIQLQCSLFIDHPLPIKWQIQLYDQNFYRTKILFAMRALQCLSLQFQHQLTINEEKQFRLHGFLHMLLNNYDEKEIEQFISKEREQTEDIYLNRRQTLVDPREFKSIIQAIQQEQTKPKQRSQNRNFTSLASQLSQKDDANNRSFEQEDLEKNQEDDQNEQNEKQNNSTKRKFIPIKFGKHQQQQQNENGQNGDFSSENLQEKLFLKKLKLQFSKKGDLDQEPIKTMNDEYTCKDLIYEKIQNIVADEITGPSLKHLTEHLRNIKFQEEIRRIQESDHNPEIKRLQELREKNQIIKENHQNLKEWLSLNFTDQIVAQSETQFNQINNEANNQENRGQQTNQIINQEKFDTLLNTVTYPQKYGSVQKSDNVSKQTTGFKPLEYLMEKRLQLDDSLLPSVQRKLEKFLEVKKSELKKKELSPTTNQEKFEKSQRVNRNYSELSLKKNQIEGLNIGQQPEVISSNKELNQLPIFKIIQKNEEYRQNLDQKVQNIFLKSRSYSALKNYAAVQRTKSQFASQSINQFDIEKNNFIQVAKKSLMVPAMIRGNYNAINSKNDNFDTEKSQQVAGFTKNIKEDVSDHTSTTFLTGDLPEKRIKTMPSQTPLRSVQTQHILTTGESPQRVQSSQKLIQSTEKGEGNLSLSETKKKSNYLTKITNYEELIEQKEKDQFYYLSETIPLAIQKNIEACGARKELNREFGQVITELNSKVKQSKEKQYDLEPLIQSKLRSQTQPAEDVKSETKEYTNNKQFNQEFNDIFQNIQNSLFYLEIRKAQINRLDDPAILKKYIDKEKNLRP